MARYIFSEHRRFGVAYIPQQPNNLSALLEFILNQKSLKPYSRSLYQISAIYNFLSRRVRHQTQRVRNRYLRGQRFATLTYTKVGKA